MTARRLRPWRLLTALALLLVPATARAQLQVGAEVARDRSTWYFENPSSIDTTELVPHSFEQRYTLDNLWLTAAAAYRAGINWRTGFGATPVRQLPATDYDTFFDPDGVTWVSGTTGDAKVHSWRVEQEAEVGLTANTTFSAGYRLRVDYADFLEGVKTVTRNGTIVASSVVTTPEYTDAQTHEVFVRGSHVRGLSSRWKVRLEGEAAPAAVNRLAIRLPEKYPGQTLVYRATTFVASGRADLIRGNTDWPVSITVSAGRSWDYDSAHQADRTAIALGVAAGRSW